MTTAALSKRDMQKRLYAGFHPGLPSKSRYTPFGNDDRVREATDLRRVELDIVVCLLAARVCGQPAVTVDQIQARTGHRAQGEMASLERRLWVQRDGKAPGSRQWRWKVTRRAAERLGFKDWEPHRFKGRCLRRVRAVWSKP